MMEDDPTSTCTDSGHDNGVDLSQNDDTEDGTDGLIIITHRSRPHPDDQDRDDGAHTNDDVEAVAVDSHHQHTKRSSDSNNEDDQEENDDDYDTGLGASEPHEECPQPFYAILQGGASGSGTSTLTSLVAGPPAAKDSHQRPP